MNHTLQIVLTLAGYYTFNAAAGAMLPPIAGAERSRYGYVYRFVQILAANSHRLAESRLPGLAAGLAASAAGGRIHERVEVDIDSTTNSRN